MSKVTWGNPRWERMMLWALRIRSPSCFGQVPTFKAAWTGDASELWPNWLKK